MLRFPRRCLRCFRPPSVSVIVVHLTSIVPRMRAVVVMYVNKTTTASGTHVILTLIVVFTVVVAVAIN